MLVTIIVAVANNGVIGAKGDLPWHLPADLKFFSKTTKGHCVLMGRKNFDSIPVKYKPLPDRTNLVVTRNTDFHFPDILVFSNLDDAVSKAKAMGETELFIIGGAEVYKQFIDAADRMYITEVVAAVDGDTYFPSFDATKWKKTLLFAHEEDAVHKHAFKTYLYSK